MWGGTLREDPPPDPDFRATPHTIYPKHLFSPYRALKSFVRIFYFLLPRVTSFLGYYITTIYVYMYGVSFDFLLRCYYIYINTKTLFNRTLKL